MSTRISGNKINIGSNTSDPGSPAVGDITFRSDTGNVRVYTSAGWRNVNVKVPTISSVSGSVYVGAASTLTINGDSFGANSQGIVTFSFGGSTYNVNATPSTEEQFTVAVPSGIYNAVSSGSTVGIQFTNGDGGTSASYGVSAQALPTGGSVSVSGTTRWHAFTSSGSLSVPSGFSKSAEVLVVAGGGGGGGRSGGGGGAGGLILHPSFTLSAGTYTVTIGSGGAGGNGEGNGGSNGGNSVFGPLTAIGGGLGGGDSPQENGHNGGSGGGGRYGNNGGSGTQPSQSGDSGTYGYGNAGGFGQANPYSGGGGGGAQNAGVSGASGDLGDGGSGKYISNMTQWGTSSNNAAGGGGYFAGGGGGGSHNPASGYGYGGVGGGGGAGPAGSNNSGQPGIANTGGGAGAGTTDSGNGGAGGTGGSGIVIVRYTL